MTYPLVDFLNQIDFSNSDVFEFGSGGSTLWWAKRAKSVTSVEYDKSWMDRLQSELPQNARIIHHPINADYARVVQQESKKFNVIVIDGAHRLSCSGIASEFLNEGGIVILDNTEWHPNSAKQLRDKGLVQIDFAGFCPLNSFPSVSSIFLHPNAASILSQRNQNSLIPPGGKAHPEGSCYDDRN